jgi:hypothetical protein
MWAATHGPVVAAAAPKRSDGPDRYQCSALLAFPLDETGAGVVEEALEEGAVVETANWSEVAQRCDSRARYWVFGRALLFSYGIELVPGLAGDAEWAAARWRPGESLSLGDRFILALGARPRSRGIDRRRGMVGGSFGPRHRMRSQGREAWGFGPKTLPRAAQESGHDCLPVASSAVLAIDRSTHTARRAPARRCSGRCPRDPARNEAHPVGRRPC